MNSRLRPWVTIVAGLPRSGTSMMMRMLDAGGMPVLIDHVRQSNADNPEGYYEFEPVKRTRLDATWLAGATGKAVKMVYRLLYDLPSDREYRVLFMRRDLEEVLASQRIMLQREQRNDGIDNEAMGALFRRDIKRFEEWLGKQAHIASLDIDYRQVVTDPRPVVKEIAEFLGGELNQNAMSGVVDVSLYRNRLSATRP